MGLLGGLFQKFFGFNGFKQDSDSDFNFAPKEVVETHREVKEIKIGRIIYECVDYRGEDGYEAGEEYKIVYFTVTSNPFSITEKEVYEWEVYEGLCEYMEKEEIFDPSDKCDFLRAEITKHEEKQKLSLTIENKKVIFKTEVPVPKDEEDDNVDLEYLSDDLASKLQHLGVDVSDEEETDLQDILDQLKP